MKWSKPAEPPGLLRCWRRIGLGPWTEWVKESVSQSRMYWRRVDDPRDTGPGVWHTWTELLNDNAIVTDQDPCPPPPDLLWSPSTQTVYLHKGGEYNLEGYRPLYRADTSLPRKEVPPKDAVSLVVKTDG